MKYQVKVTHPVIKCMLDNMQEDNVDDEVDFVVTHDTPVVVDDEECNFTFGDGRLSCKDIWAEGTIIISSIPWVITFLMHLTHTPQERRAIADKYIERERFNIGDGSEQDTPWVKKFIDSLDLEGDWSI